MQDTLDNFLRMVALVIQFFADNAKITTDAPAVGDVVEKVTSRRDSINSMLEKRGGRASGLTGTKSEMQLKLANTANRVLQALHSIAAGGNLPDLLKQTDLSTWKLLKLRDKALVDKCKEVYAMAQPYAEKLAGYGIKTELLGSLLTGSEEYGNMITAVGTTMRNKAVITLNLEEAGDELKRLLDDELDPAVEAVLGMDNSELFKQYVKVREVINYGVRHEDKPVEENTGTAAETTG